MKNKINHSMLAVMGLMTLKAQAVGLGELVVHSKLGEPLTAEIKIIQSNGEFISADDLVVNIATENEHAKRSLDGYFARQNLQLKLTETLSDDVSLKLSSDQAINEPFLNFLVELKWNAGRIIKEFTVLLDPPGFQAEQIAQPTNVVESTAVVTESPKKTQQTYRFEPTNKVVSNTPFVDGQYGPVQKGETLSEIAMRVRPAGYGIPLVTMIDAIYSNNPDAFINGDKNLLQRGVVLTIPDVNDVLAYDGSSVNVAQTVKNKPVTQAQPINDEHAVIHFASAPAVNLETSYTFSGLKLSTELDRSFLAVARTMATESFQESTNELTEPAVVAEETTEVVEAEVIETPVAEIEAETVEPINTVSSSSEEFDNDTSSSNEVVETDVVAIESEPAVDDEAPVDYVFESSVEAIETGNENQAVTESENVSSSNPFYLAMSIIGAILFLSMSALLFFFRRNREDEFRPNINLNTNKADVIPSRVFINEEKDITPTVAEPVEALEEVAESHDSEADDLMDMEQTISEKNTHIATVVMSPEEFEEVGVDINQQEGDFYLDKEHDETTAEDDQTLIKDFLDTIEIPDNIDDEPVIEEHSDFSIIEKATEPSEESEEDETFIDISIPLNHQDNEVNTIINEILEGELDEEPVELVDEAPAENDSLIIDSESDFIDIPESENTVDDLELKTISHNANEMREHNELVDLDSDIDTPSELEPLEFDNPEIDALEEPEVLDSPNIEDLVVNFQTSHPEKEFEKQVSVFMAYGDYVGAEEVIEKALQQSPKNNTYRLAQLSLFKATGKFGAALVLSEELNLIKHELTEIEQKKLELLSDDLNQADDDSINVAS